MTIYSDTIKLQYLKPGKGILAALLTVLLITGCASSPPQEQKTDPSQQTADFGFEQAREAYLEFDYETATRLLNTLAAQGDASAQYALGYMYYYGFGVAHDEAIALEWIKKAAARGHPDAIIALDRVKVSARNEQSRTVINTRPQARQSVEPDQHAQFMMQAEAIIAEETEKSSPEAMPEQEEISDQATSDQNPETRTEQTSDNNAEQTATTPAKMTATTETPAISTPGQDWVLKQNPNHFTIQVISGSNEQRVKQYMEKNGLTMQSAHFGLQRNDQPIVYIGVYGVYSSFAEARKIVQSLPAEVQEAQPWIRSFKSIQATLR